MKQVLGLDQFSLGPIRPDGKNLAESGALSCALPLHYTHSLCIEKKTFTGTTHPPHFVLALLATKNMNYYLQYLLCIFYLCQYYINCAPKPSIPPRYKQTQKRHTKIQNQNILVRHRYNTGTNKHKKSTH